MRMMANVPTFIHYGARLGSKSHKSYRIVFIPGNPGLIAYYADFLRLLKTALEDNPSKTKSNNGFDICGRSLFGFEITREHVENPSKNDLRPPQYPLSLNQQIDRVQSYVEALPASESDDLGLILIGHSVGAFIMLELLHRFNVRSKDQVKVPRIVGAVSLFPTIVDIAKSPSGQKVSWLLQIPYFALLISLLVKFGNFVLSVQILTTLVAWMTSFPEHATLATVAFLRSRLGVFQALYMARDEMRQIAADRWGEEVWGSPNTRSPALYFYFGEKDHWVAESTRDHIIATRGSKADLGNNCGPRMEIDRLHIPHGFCIRHSNLIAQKCSYYIQSMVEADQSR